ncbi:MAG TPA: DUF935 family protein [Chitinophagales bacterium]|nr:DUF935 family protein [Chitinophagales bacterium]
MSKFTDNIKSYLPKVFLSSQKPTNSPPKPDAKKRASQMVKAKPKSVVSYQISDIKKALTLALNSEKPNRNLLYAIYDYVLEDSQLWFQIYLVALKKVLIEPFALYSNGKIDEESTKLIKKKWFETLIKYIFESEFFGFRMVELVINDGKAEIELIPNQNVCPEYKTIWLVDVWQKPMLEYDGIEDDLNLLFFGEKKDLGSLRKAAYNILWKFYAQSDWSRSSEKFGMALLHIKANTNNDTELDRLEEKAANFGSDGYLVSQDGDDAQIIERKSDNSHLIFYDRIKYSDEQSSKVSNGQTGTSDEKAFVGSAGVHERILDDMILSRLTNISYEINDQVLPYLIKRGYIPASIDEFKFINLDKKKDDTSGDAPKAEDTPTPPTKPNPKKRK